jgi:prophage tail gpP-like protein
MLLNECDPSNAPQGSSGNLAEVATVVVNDRQFNNWESVYIQQRWAEAFPIFKFTTADIVEVPPKDWQTLQFKPRDTCSIYLGGLLAISGFITTRQTSYDAENHQVQLEGVGLTWFAARASILHPTGNFDGKTFEEVADEVIGPTGVGICKVGTLDATPFERLSSEVGETVWDFLERIARVRGIVLGSDHLGNFLLIGNHWFTPTDSVVEGVNIKRMNAIIHVGDIFSEYRVRGQSAASDPQFGPQASEQESQPVPGTSVRYSPLLVPAEQPVWGQGELDMRAQHEAVWHEGTEIQVTVVVQGWMRPSGGLWRPGQDVWVRSPMAMLDMVMKVQMITFTQDRASGTLTTLDLVPPWLLKDQGEWNVSRLGAPPAPGGGTSAQPGQPFGQPPDMLPGARPPPGGGV